MKVSILFTSTVRQEIRNTVAARTDGYSLPESFDTEGQVFEKVDEVIYTDGGSAIGVVVPSRMDENKKAVYIYPMRDISRVKVDDIEDTSRLSF